MSSLRGSTALALTPKLWFARSHRWLIFVVLFLACLLRFHALDQVQLRGDQTSVLSLAQAAWEQRRLPAHSTGSSVGVIPPPLEIWLLMPVVALVPEHGSALVVAVLLWTGLDLIVVALLYRLGRSGAGPTAGLIAAAGYGSSFWAIIFARRIRGDDLMPLFTVVSVACWWRFARGSPWFFPPALLAASLLLEVHLAAVFLLPLVFAGVLLGRRSLRPAPVALGLVLAVLPWLPYLFWQSQEGFANVQRALALGGSPGIVDGASLRQLELLTSVSSGVPFLGVLSGAPFTEPRWAELIRRAWHGWLILAVVLVLSGLRRALTDRPGLPTATQALWLLAATAAFAPFLLLLRHSWPVQVHYLLGSLPPAYLLIGLSFATVTRGITRNGPSLGRTFALTLVGTLVVAPALYQAVTVLRFYRWQEESVTPFHGLPLRWWRDFSDRAAKTAEDLALPGFAFTDEGYVDSLLYSSAGRFPIRLVAPNALVLPPQGPFVALGTSESSPAAGQLRSHGSFQRLPWPGGGDAAWIARLEQPALEDLRTRTASPSLPWRIGDVLQFDARAADKILNSGSVLRVELRWRVLAAPGPRSDYGFFIHLTDGDRVSHQSLTVSPTLSSEWRPDELAFAAYLLAIPVGLEPGRYHLAVGLYDPATGARLPLTSPTQRVEPDGAVYLGPLKAPMPVPARLPLPAALQPEAVFERQIALVGASLAGDELRLQWRAGSTIEEDLTRFVHLVDGEGRLRWQSDGYPHDGTYPTSIWDEGELVEEMITLPSLADLDGSWRLVIGWYRQLGVERLRLTAGPAGQPLDRLEVPIAGLSTAP